MLDALVARLRHDPADAMRDVAEGLAALIATVTRQR